MTILDFFISRQPRPQGFSLKKWVGRPTHFLREKPWGRGLSVAEKNCLLSRDYFGSWENVLVAVTVVKRFKLEEMYGLSAPGQNKVAVVEVGLCQEG